MSEELKTVLLLLAIFFTYCVASDMDYTDQTTPTTTTRGYLK